VAAGAPILLAAGSRQGDRGIAQRCTPRSVAVV